MDGMFAFLLLIYWTDVGECHGFPGPGKSDRVYTFNPFREFIGGHTNHVDDSFETFKKHHKKKYNETDHTNRKNIFRQNMRYI